MGDQVPYDPGLGYTPGFISPGVPEFALSSGDTPGVAASIAQAGGEVTVDNLGGINMIASSTAFVGIDSFANITINTGITAGAVSIQTFGGGNDVDILNAGRIDFDALGDGALTGIQTINGSVYPPTGSGATTSITQAGALVACLGSGGITISSIGGGVVTDVVNAGTITFDASGSAAITGLSTLNGVSVDSLFPTSISSITGGGATVECDANGTIALQSGASPFITLNTLTSSISLSAGSGFGNILLQDQTVTIDNPGSAIPASMNMDINGVVLIQGAAVNLTNAGSIDFNAGAGIITELSTINGVPWVNGSAPYVLPADITVSTLTADSVSTTSLLVSSINGAEYPPAQYALPADITVSTIAGVSTIEANPNVPFDFLHLGAFNFNLSTLGNLTLDSGLGMALNGVSTIVGSDIYMEANNLRLVDAGGSGFKILSGQPSVAGANGLVVDANLSVSTITDISTINGVSYPNAVRQATYYNSVAQNLTSGNTDLTFDLSGAWNFDDGYVTHTDGTTDFTVVQAGLYQLEFNTTVLANGATWTATTNKNLVFVLTRSASPQAIVVQSANTASAANYGQAASVSYYLEAGDIINCRLFNTYTTGTPTAMGVSGFDLGTFFTWRYIS